MATTDFEIADLTARFEGDLTIWPDEYVNQQIEDAVAYIVDECPTVPDRLGSGALSPVVYKRVVANVVSRVLRNPAGRTNESEQGVSFGNNPLLASGDLWLSEQDKRRLNGRGRTLLPGSVAIGYDDGRTIRSSW